VVAPATAHTLIVSEDNGNAAAIEEAAARLAAGDTVTWICSTPDSQRLPELEAMAALKNAYMSTFNLMVITRNEQQPFDVLSGLLNQARLQECVGTLFQAEAVTRALIACTPTTQPDILSWAKTLFPSVGELSHQPATTGQLDSSTPGDSSANQIDVTIVMLGRKQTFQMHEADGTLLDGAELAGIDLPYSCRGGVCSTCRTKLQEGEVRLLDNYALEDWELAAGFTLPCQAKPVSAKITLDYDEA